MLPEEVTRFIGQVGPTATYQVEKGAIARFAEAVGDPNPLYWDEEYAKKSRYGSIIAPPGFFGWPVRRPASDAAPAQVMQRPDMAAAGYGLVYNGGIEYELLSPIKAGDTLTAQSVIKDIYLREGRTGELAFVIRETTYTNQNGEVVARARGTSIHPKGQPAN